jgi:hypothetical protein
MAHRNLPSRSSGSNLDSASPLDQAIAERDRFLESHPQYRTMQKEIDRLLDKAGTSENRMAVLALLMESKLMELYGELQQLNRILLSIQRK